MKHFVFVHRWLQTKGFMKASSSKHLDSGTPKSARPVIRQRRQIGSSLIEVMVSLLLLSIGLVGSMQLLSSAIKEQSALRYKATAMRVAQDLAERMRGNRLAVLAGAYIDTTPFIYSGTRLLVSNQVAPETLSCHPNCTTEKDVATLDLASVRFGLKTLLPGAAISVTNLTIGTPPVSIKSASVITIAWVEPILDVTVSAASPQGEAALLNNTNSGCPTGFNDDTTGTLNLRCLQIAVQI